MFESNTKSVESEIEDNGLMSEDLLQEVAEENEEPSVSDKETSSQQNEYSDEENEEEDNGNVDHDNFNDVDII
ncbi:MAG: hypothetical protein LR008_03495 [Candidatus Pacebacteria bacterium]|nr:hypothetical protein [Candidatus Paceibacterota bacterium]